MLPPAVASYYAALDAGDDDAAAAAFAEDAVYIRPAFDPAAGGDGIEVFRGRAAARREERHLRRFGLTLALEHEPRRLRLPRGKYEDGEVPDSDVLVEAARSH